MTTKDINNKYLQRSSLELYSLDEHIFVTVGKVMVSHIIITIFSFGILLLAVLNYGAISEGIYHLYSHDSTPILSLHLLPYAMLMLIIITSLDRNKPQWLRLIILLTIILSIITIICEIII